MRVWLFIFCLLVVSPAPLPAHATWRNGTPAPRAVSHAVGAVLNNQLYVMDAAASTGGRPFFELYDVANDGWRPLAPLPVSLARFALAANDGRLYVSGGRDADNPDAAGNIWIYIPEAAIWVRRAALPTPRAAHASVAAHGKIYLLGGVGEGAKQVQVYDVATNRWHTFNAPPPVPVAHSTAALWGDEIVLVGGIKLAGDGAQAGRDVAVVQAFHTKHGTWRRLPDLPRPASGVAVAVLGGALHALGGYAQSAQSVLATHLRLDMQNKEWQALPPMAQGRHQMAVGSVGKNLVLVGGALGGGFYALFTATDQVSLYAP